MLSAGAFSFWAISITMIGAGVGYKKYYVTNFLYHQLFATIETRIESDHASLMHLVTDTLSTAAQLAAIAAFLYMVWRDLGQESDSKKTLNTTFFAFRLPGFAILKKNRCAGISPHRWARAFLKKSENTVFTPYLMRELLKKC